MIVIATEDFRLYHEAVSVLRERNATFTTVEPGEELPVRTDVVVAAPSDTVPLDENPDVTRVDVESDDVQAGIEEALAVLHGGGGRMIVGVDPGPQPGIAVLVGDTVVTAHQVPLSDAVETIREAVADSVDPLVRVGDGDRLKGARIVNDLDEVPVELVDETRTTPYLGDGARGMADVLAAVNIAGREGDRVESREIDPTEGELKRIKTESRKRSAGDRTIGEPLARRVADGDLTLDQAIAEHRDDSRNSVGAER